MARLFSRIPQRGVSSELADTTHTRPWRPLSSSLLLILSQTPRLPGLAPSSLPPSKNAPQTFLLRLYILTLSQQTTHSQSSRCTTCADVQVCRINQGEIFAVNGDKSITLADNLRHVGHDIAVSLTALRFPPFVPFSFLSLLLHAPKPPARVYKIS